MDDAHTDAEGLTGAPLQGNPNYLRAVTEMGERCHVVAREAICSENGIKLIDAGMRIDRRLYERLTQHKLDGAIEAQLEVEDAVSVASLVAIARTQCAEDALVGLLARALGERGGDERLLAPLQALTLAQPLAFTLTVMRERLPDLLAHSVRVALVAVFLGLRSGQGAAQCVQLACAGLLHDIGNLYMDPAWHDASQRITGEGRKQLLAHPITASLLIQAHGTYPVAVRRAVLEHHERMDGSGYPRHRQGREISALGQVLLLAEVVAAFFEKYGGAAATERLLLTLNLQRRAFPADLVALLLPVLQGASSPASPDAAQAQQQVGEITRRLAQAFDDWDARAAALPPPSLDAGARSAAALVHQRLRTLQRNLLEAGSHPRQLAEALPYLLEDAQGLTELVYLGREALWQLQGVVNAVSTRWPQLAQSADDGDVAVAQWCAARGGASAAPS